MSDNDFPGFEEYEKKPDALYALRLDLQHIYAIGERVGADRIELVMNDGRNYSIVLHMNGYDVVAFNHDFVARDADGKLYSIPSDDFYSAWARSNRSL